MKTQEKIFNNYDLRMKKNSDELKNERKFIRKLFRQTYLPHIEKKNPMILEIGCNKGFMLLAMDECIPGGGVVGCDLSPQDVAYAKILNPTLKIYCKNAFDMLREGTYDIIVSKDVMEHIGKEEQEEFVELIYHALRPGGVALIQVPNMDWIFANHERYMDFTHEIGYTRESLADIFRLFFSADHIMIHPVSYIFKDSLKRKIIFGIFRPIFLKVLRAFLKLLGDGADDVWFECREILVVAKKENLK